MIENHPPAKGPIPRHLAVQVVYQATKAGSRDFRFEFPPKHRQERREMLEAILEHSHDKSVIEKITASVVDDEPYGERVRMGERVDLRHHVETVSKLSIEQASRLLYGYGRTSRFLVSELPAKPLTVKLTYPLSLGVELRVRPFIAIYKVGGKAGAPRERRQTLGYLLWMVAQEYQRIYSEASKYKIWGHAISDLYFEGMRLVRGGVQLLVGSR